MSSNRRRRLPVHIITGFLGAGKTTFLNQFVQNQLPERILVVENECGDTNIDGALIIDGVEDIVELTSGCLCCSLAGGLMDVLYEVSKKIDQLDRLIIETTGIADPNSIMQVFLEDYRVDQLFELEQIVCMVDALNIEDWLGKTEEALRQIAASDVILVNKMDTIEREKQNHLESLMNGINPYATTFFGSHGQFPMNQILSIGTINPRSILEKTKEIEDNHDHHHHIHNDHGISTFSVSFTKPIDLNDISLELNRLVNLYSDQIYRVKGIIAIPNYPNRVILQSAKSAFIASDGLPWETEHDRAGKLVFIGKNIKSLNLKELFERYQLEPN